MAIRAVVFDVGETLFEEGRPWADWADWIDVPPATLLAALGAVIAQRRHHREAFSLLRPGMVFEEERARKIAAGRLWLLEEDDLYPDARRCLARLRDLGYRVGVAGNQPQSMLDALAEMDLAVDFTGSSESWGVEKPDPAFFARVEALARVSASEICYVGDRVDNDVVPAQSAGMSGVLIRRGPWGYVQATWPEAAEADAVIDSLDELPEVLGRLDARSDAPRL
ncbi:MAG: HAD-superfamily hydrolase, subfamily variant 1 [Acidimicrobiaceae bacterium]|nr:HAD-superfamily hydrolase, subfamily variant 1 [Acidimicrobiaceae bacterium]